MTTAREQTEARDEYRRWAQDLSLCPQTAPFDNLRVYLNRRAKEAADRYFALLEKQK